MNIKTKQSLIILFSSFVFGYISIAFVFSILRVDVLQSDVLGYWQDSLTLDAPFNPFHVPGYSAVIGLLRFVTFSVFPPVLYLQCISFCCFGLALFLTFQIGMRLSTAETSALQASILFMLWPMVGLTYVVYPVADSLAVALYLLGAFLLLTGRSLLGVIAWAIVLFVHKAMWCFVGFGYFMWFCVHFRFSFRRVFGYAVPLLAPLILFIYWGSLYHGSLTWIVSSNLNMEVISGNSLHLFNGLLGTFDNLNLQSLVKGGLFLSQFLLAFFLVLHAWKRRYQGWELGFSIAFATLVLMSVLNHYEIWASIRFGRLLAIPIVASLDVPLSSKFQASIYPRLVIGVLIGILFISQVFYTWYLKAFFGG